MTAKDIAQQLLSNALVTAVIMSIVGGALRIIRDKRRKRRIDDSDAYDRVTEMQAAAESHLLNFDVPLLERVRQHEALINQLRRDSGQKDVPFEPLPTPVPLFPTHKRESKGE